MISNKVNTFIVGAQKAGTTSLYQWLGQHPQVYAPEILKDYHFFSNPEYFQKGIQHLESFYRDENRIQLHGAVNYIYFHEISAPRIHEYNKDAKIIICLRDPVERAISAYKYFKRTLRETDSFSVALQKELNGELSTFEELANKTYIEHGRYCEQILSFLNYFNRDQIKIVLFEDLIEKKKQANIMKEICSFLGIDNNHTFNFNHLNASGRPKSFLINHLVRKSKLKSLFSWIIPFHKRKIIKKKVEEFNISNKKLEVEISDEDICLLVETLKEEKNHLSKVLGEKIESKWDFTKVENEDE